MTRNYTIMKNCKGVKFWIADHEEQRVAAMLCFTAEGHMFENYITVIRKLHVPKNGFVLYAQ